MSRSNQTSLRLAIFDFDGTLCRLNSYHVFLWWAAKRFCASGLRVLAGLVLRKLKVIDRPTLMSLSLHLLKGKTRSKVEMIGRDLYDSLLKPAISEAGLAEIRAKRKEGCTILILSGAFDFLLAPFCASQGIDCWRSTRLAYEQERCTGLLEGGEHLAETKSVHLQELFADHDVDWQASSVYSDELTDIPLFSLVGNKYFVVHDGNSPPKLPSDMKILRW